MPKHKLERRLGLFSATVAGVGTIIGAGIFVLIGLVASTAGNSLWISFILAALAAIFTGLSYAELASMMPKDEGECLYGKRALGRFIGFFAAVMMVIATIFAATAVALGFAGYFSSLTGIPFIVLIAASVLLLFTFFNWHGIKDISVINLIFTLASIFVLIFIIALAFFKGNAVNLMSMPYGWTGIFKGASLVFFAYLGFEGIIKLTEETKNPTKTIPRAIILSILITTVLYIAVAIAAVSILDWQILAASAAPLADVAATILGSKAFLIVGIVALFATANTILLSLVYASRGLYGLGEEFKKLKAFTKVGIRDTPTLAIVLTTILALLFLLIGGLEIVAEMTNFSVFIVFLIVNLSVIVLRYKEEKTKRPFKIPLRIGKFPLVPLLGILTVLFLMVNVKPIVLLLGTGLVVLMIPIYFLIK